MVSRTAQ